MREWLKTSDVFIIARDRSGQPPGPICHTNAGLLIRQYVAGAKIDRDSQYGVYYGVFTKGSTEREIDVLSEILYVTKKKNVHGTVDRELYSLQSRDTIHENVRKKKEEEKRTKRQNAKAACIRSS